MSRRYRGYDLIFESAFDIPGATEIERGEAGVTPDVTIMKQHVALESWYDRRGHFARLGRGMVASLPGRANYLCADSNHILVDPAPGAAAADIAAGLSAFAIPALLWMRGDILLHAGAVILPGADAAIIVAGHSGSGKTTVLRQCAEAGARIVADDIIRITPGFAISGLPAGLSASAGGSYCEIPLEQRCAVAVLDAVHVLTVPRAPEAPAFHALAVERRMHVLLAYQYRPRIPRMLGLARTMLPALARIAEAVPMYDWRREEGQVALGESEVAALCAGSGLHLAPDA
ncbi:hypothetical protein OF829_12525 [Sphingomonas sp. LB-2]|uniref:hypothetical protein n=1 Tax=Sphingomonas caeni TaxID=2984949 RepID=UPI00222E4816|nr:hypothetical protein [Sphingomonas caeni]MCW3848067.1 hypothetical protein [Sphingomonas caeni]